MVNIVKRTSAMASFGRLWHEVRDDLFTHRWLFVGSVVALLSQVGFRLLIPWPLKLVFDDVLINPEHRLTIGSLSIGTSESIFLLSILVVVTIGFRSLAAYLCKLSLANLSARLLKALRARLFFALNSDPDSGRHRHGDLAIRLTTDVERLRNTMVHVLLPVLANILATIGMFAVMGWMNLQLAVVVFAGAVPCFLLARLLAQRIAIKASQHRRSESDLASTTVDNFGARSATPDASEARFDQEFLQQNERNLDRGTEMVAASASLQRAIEVLSALVLALVVWRGSNLVINQQITPGDLLVFVTYLQTAMNQSFRKIGRQFSQLSQSCVSIDRLMAVLDQSIDAREESTDCGATEEHPICL